MVNSIRAMKNPHTHTFKRSRSAHSSAARSPGPRHTTAPQPMQLELKTANVHFCTYYDFSFHLIMAVVEKGRFGDPAIDDRCFFCLSSTAVDRYLVG